MMEHPSCTREPIEDSVSSGTAAKCLVVSSRCRVPDGWREQGEARRRPMAVDTDWSVVQTSALTVHATNQEAS